MDNVHLFLELLDEFDIKATFFVVGTVAKKRSKLLQEIHKQGHEIGCHSLDHELLYNESFHKLPEILRAGKALVEEAVGCEVYGFRAPCFSITERIVPLIRDCGFMYDSSYIRITHHDFYGRVNFSDWNQISDYVYEKDGFYEFEMPSLNIGPFRIPWSGGGYFRLIPYPLFRLGLGRIINGRREIQFYIHPFELRNSTELPDTLPLKYRFRYQVGRGKIIGRLRRLFSEPNLIFKTHIEYIRTLSGSSY
jgi:polysaccharide deacetylase family protein (PEP-CTERM system associated)